MYIFLYGVVYSRVKPSIYLYRMSKRYYAGEVVRNSMKVVYTVFTKVVWNITGLTPSQTRESRTSRPTLQVEIGTVLLPFCPNPDSSVYGDLKMKPTVADGVNWLIPDPR